MTDKDKALDNDQGGNKDTNPKPEDNPTSEDFNKIKAQHNSAQAELRIANTSMKTMQAQLDDLKAKQSPPEDGERLAALEVELARSKAVSRHGLSEDDAGLLKGSPAQILEDAEYWSNRLKDQKPVPKEDKSNKDIIDDKIDNANNSNSDNPPPKPTPKKGNLSWMDQYKQANPAERYKMDQAVLTGDVDPTK